MKYNDYLFKASFDPRDKSKNIREYQKEFLRRLQSMFKITGLENTKINIRNFNNYSFTQGMAGLILFNDDWYCLQGSGAGELDENFDFTRWVATSPWLKVSKEFEVGKDCFIIYNDSMKQGLLPIINKYCSMLVETELTMYMNVINSRNQNVLLGSDDSQVQSINQFFKDLESGKFGAIVDDVFVEGLKTIKAIPLRQSTSNEFMYLMELHTYFFNCLLNELGIDASRTLKREALASQEVGVNSQMLYPLVDDMLTQKQLYFDKFNEATGLNVKVELNSSWLVNHDENNNNINDELEKGGDEDESEENSEQETVSTS